MFDLEAGDSDDVHGDAGADSESIAIAGVIA